MKSMTALLFALLLSIVALQGCEQADAAPEPPTAEDGVVSVEVAQVTRADFVESARYVAELAPSAQVEIFSPVTERVESLPWEDGDRIEEGEVLAKIRKKSLSKSLKQVDAELESFDIQIGTQKRELKRVKELHKKHVATQQSVDQAQDAYDALKAQKKAAKASRDQLRLTVADATIEAPMSGVIAQRQVDEGDFATSQAPLCVILQVDPLEVSIALTAEDAAKVEIGDKITLSFDAFPGERFEASIVRTSPTYHQLTRTNTVIAQLPNPDPASKVKPGMYARAEVTLSERAGALALPASALRSLPGLSADEREVWVIGEAGFAEARRVIVGARSGEQVEIVEGLSFGEQVVLRGGERLREGVEVAILEGERRE